MALSEAQKRANAKYNKEKMKQIAIRFSPNEMDVFEHVKSQPNIAGYIKQLVREDMARGEFADVRAEGTVFRWQSRMEGE